MFSVELQENIQHRIEENVQVRQMNERMFVAALTKSNTDGKSHGVV